MAESQNPTNQNGSARERRSRRTQSRPSREQAAGASISRPAAGSRRVNSRPLAQKQPAAFQSLQVKLTQSMDRGADRDERRQPASPHRSQTVRRQIGGGAVETGFGLHPRRDRRTTSTRPAPPPVMVRSGPEQVLVRKPRQKVARRRFDVSLDVPGAELRLPSVPMVPMGMRAVSGILAVMMIACLFFLWKSPAFSVSVVEAEGLSRLTVGDLNAVMGIVGSSIFGIDPQQIEQRLGASFPELANISIKTNLPAQITIVAVERQPVLAWFQDGSEVWIDAEGVTFPPRGNPGTLVRVEGRGTPPQAVSQITQTSLPGMIPGASAEIERVRLPAELVTAIVSLGSQMPPETVLVYDSEYGLGWNDPMGWDVYFGTQGEDMEMKMNVYQSLVEYLQSQGIQPALISVEHVHAPFYRMER